MLENLLDIVGTLYKFHEKPVTYLYNTFHYYDKKLKRYASFAAKREMLSI